MTSNTTITTTYYLIINIVHLEQDIKKITGQGKSVTIVGLMLTRNLIFMIVYNY